MKKTYILFLMSFLLLLPVSELAAQDQAASRSVAGREQAADAQIVINQIDTSAFPKVTLFASVTKDGVPLKGLNADNFRVREDEVDQEPITVVPKLTPLNAVVALDTSGSMKQRMADAQSAAKSFIQLLSPEDKVQVLSFAREVKILAADGGRESAEAAVEAVSARGDTALYDALYASVEMLKDTPGRKAVTLLSDGADDDGTGKQLSKHSVEDALRLAREVNVPIYTVGVGTELDEAALKKVAAETGGANLITPQPEQLKELYAKIGEQLVGQYSIQYTSNLPGDGSEHKVQLKHKDAVGAKEYKAPLKEEAKAKPEPVVETDILTPEYMELIKAPQAAWEHLLDVGLDSSIRYAESGKAVFGFKDEHTATFDAVRIFINETDSYNVKTLELLFSAASHSGPFESAGMFEVENIRMMKTGGWQEFKFPPVTAKYVVFKMASHDGTWMRIIKDSKAGKGIQLMGHLNP